MDDLESFIANIEETAPEEHQTSKLVCIECNVQLEEGEDGNFVCPNCSAKASGLLQLDETELHHDDQGRPVFGQRVRTQERVRKHHTDYGWAWSTDDAVDHILNLQIAALEQAKLVPDFFRVGLANMWLKFWLDYVAPHIKDAYEEDELIPINTKRKVKLRDIEVLVKLRDKVMIPAQLVSRHGKGKVIYKMYGSRFRNKKPDNNEPVPEDELELGGGQTDDYSSSCSSFNEAELASRQLLQRSEEGTEGKNPPVEPCDIQPNELNLNSMNLDGQPIQQAPETQHGPSTKNLSDDSIEILTLNRTLAFIEATARCMKQNDPLFAADIIRACNQRLLPFFGASKLLPDGMNLNALDKLMFQKTRPPTPIQLTRTASLLIHKVYKDKLPKKLPTPNLNSILERFISDLNLPYDLYLRIKDQYDFTDFPATRPILFRADSNRRLPQYDRWAFAVLLCQLKRLFNLSDTYLTLVSERAQLESRDKNELYFDINSWLQQLSIRLDLIFSYDAFVLYHPMADIGKLECTPQLGKYIETILEDRASATIRLKPNAPNYDDIFRKEVGDFINRQLALSKCTENPKFSKEELDSSAKIKLPLTDAMERTQRFWQSEIENDEEICELVHKDFRSAKLLLPTSMPTWSIYDQGVSLSRWKLEISPKWPHAYRQLLNAGGFLCFCDPVELMNEIRIVEESLIPHARIVKRMNVARNKAAD